MSVFGFQWILPGKLAGSGCPGLLGSIEEHYAWLREAGVRVVVSLTEEPLVPPPSAHGLRGIHLPIEDMSVPTLDEAFRLCAEVDAALAAGEPAVFHCYAGIGRTGTMLACYLVHLGRSARRAVDEIRERDERYIQTDEQLRFVARFAAAKKARGDDP